MGMVKLIKYYDEEVVCRDGGRLGENRVLRRDMRKSGP